VIDDSELRELRAEIQQLGPTSPARRYHDALKAKIVKWVATQRHAGAGAGEVAQAIGIPWETLGRWLREGGSAAPPSRAAGLRPVRVVDAGARASSTLVLRTPRGFTVEGLDFDAVVMLLERLG